LASTPADATPSQIHPGNVTPTPSTQAGASTAGRVRRPVGAVTAAGHDRPTPTAVSRGPADAARGCAPARARSEACEPSGGPARCVARSPYEVRRRPPPLSTVPGLVLESASA